MILFNRRNEGNEGVRGRVEILNVTDREYEMTLKAIFLIGVFVGVSGCSVKENAPEPSRNEGPAIPAASVGSQSDSRIIALEKRLKAAEAKLEQLELVAAREAIYANELILEYQAKKQIDLLASRDSGLVTIGSEGTGKIELWTTSDRAELTIESPNRKRRITLRALDNITVVEKSD